MLILQKYAYTKKVSVVWYLNLTELYPVFLFAQFGNPDLEQSKKERGVCLVPLPFSANRCYFPS